MHAKSQTSTELIILLAVSIAIAVLAVSVVGDFTFFGASGTSSADAIQLSTENIGIITVIVTPQGSTLQVANNLQNIIQITNVTMGSTLCTSNNLPLTLEKKEGGEIFCANINMSEDAKTFEYDYLIEYMDIITGAQYSQNTISLAGEISPYNIE